MWVQHRVVQQLLHASKEVLIKVFEPASEKFI
jgi:hypothetical protein